ncbi:MAG: hypothetical protein HYZ19_04215 [Rhodocyclales bacterium]|nr:hypothetical protein [Rhodocyclales bacterium]
MAVNVKKIVLWRKEVGNEPGALAGVLAPLAEAGTDLQVIMGTSLPDDDTKASIGLFPVKGKKSVAAAQAAGLTEAAVPALLVDGDNKPGLGHKIAGMVADAGINIGFVFAQVLGKKFSAVFGFRNDADAAKAATLIKKAAAVKASAAKKPAKKAAKKR